MPSEEHRLASILNLVSYCHDFLRGARSEAKGRLHLRRGAAKGGYLDVATLATTETLLFGDAGELLVRPVQQGDVLAPLAELRQRMLDLEAELGRSLVFEASPWGVTGKKPGELAAEYARCREDDQMAEGEAVAWGQQEEAVGLLEPAVSLRRRLGDHRLDLARLCESTELPENNEIEPVLQDMLSIVDALEEEAKLCPRAEAAEVKQLPLFPLRPACASEEVGELKEALALQIHRLDDLIGKETVQATIEATTNHDQAACQADLESLHEFIEALPRLRKLEEDSAACGDGSVQPEQLAEALEVYEAHRARWWSWLFPAFRRQRRIVATALGREHLTRATDISPLRAWIEAHRLRMKLSALRVRRLSHLPIQEISAHFDIADERRLVGLCSTVKEVLQVRDVACQLSTKIVTALSREVSSDLLVDHGRLKQLYDQFVSHSIENFPPGLVRDFLRHAANPRAAVLDGKPCDSKFEQDVHAFLENEIKGLQVTPQVKVWPRKPVDFVLRGPNGRIAALEADGWEIHYPDGHLREEDKIIQREMERKGNVVSLQ